MYLVIGRLYVKAERSLLHRSKGKKKNCMHYCASTHQTSLESKSRLNQEHKAQGKGGAGLFWCSSEKKQVRPREVRRTFPQRERESRWTERPTAEKGDRRGIRRQNGKPPSPSRFFFKKKSPCSPLSPGFPCPPYARTRTRDQVRWGDGGTGNGHVLDAHALFPACFPDVRLTGFIRWWEESD